jgi:capsular exopolysaccharide synthesis family protein
MSLIFDALQRSESERSGAGLLTLRGAAEVLRSAELHAAAERKAKSQREQSTETQHAGRDTAPPLPALESPPPKADSPAVAELPPGDKHLDAFGQYQVLTLSVPPKSRLVALNDSESLAAEKFGFLAIRLQHLRRDRSLKKVLITSTIPQEGKSMVSANLACTLARRTQQRTLLVEGDLRRPSLSQVFGLEKNPGICEWLQGERDLMASIYYLEDAGLCFLPAGSTRRNPLELLQSGGLSEMMNQLNERFDWIIIDSPPVMPLADTSLWMRLADGILLVVRQGITDKRQLARGLEALEPKKMIGALLNGSNAPTRGDYYYTKASSTATGSR